MKMHSGIAGVSPVITPQRVVGTALPMDTLGTGIDLKTTISVDAYLTIAQPDHGRPNDT